MKTLFLIIFFLFPALASAEIYTWIDSNGVVTYSNEPKNTPEDARNTTSAKSVAEPEATLPDKQKKIDENSLRFANETIERLTVLSRQLDDGIKYVDEYYERSRPVSKSLLVSYLNSMSNEIANLKYIHNNSSLPDQARRTLATRIAGFENSYAAYTTILNDFESIEVNNFKFETQLDIRTMTNWDAIRQTNYSTGDEKSIFTFSANIANTGSRADIILTLSGLNFESRPVASHTIKTTIGSNERREVGDRLTLDRTASRDIDKWIISDVKILRSRK